MGTRSHVCVLDYTPQSLAPPPPSRYASPMAIDLRLTNAGARRFQDGHPWVFKGDVAWNSALDFAEPGELVRFCDPRLKPLGVGMFNPRTRNNFV